MNAAHDAPSIYHCDTGEFLATGGADVPIGIDPEWAYTEHALVLPPGRSIVAIGTDGIWETERTPGKPFGRARFHDLIRAGAERSAADICSSIMDAVAEYRGPGPTADDVTLVVVRFTVGAPVAAKGTA